MNHPLLDPHDTIAWDMDYTLVKGPNSTFFRNYVAANPHKKHHIVTFRTPREWADGSLIELSRKGLDPKLITSVAGVPDELYAAYAQRRSFYQPEKVDAYVRWKGMMAAQLGCTVLVDDMKDQVILGCLENNVEFVDSFDKSFGRADDGWAFTYQDDDDAA